MSTPTHTGRAHALLGASKASQWLNCTPSARIQEDIKDTPSEFAEEGTVAHELSEIKLRQYLEVNNSKQRNALAKAMKKIKANKYYSAEMDEHTDEYKTIVSERFSEAKSRSSDAIIQFESRLDFSEWVPDGFGTGDVIIIADSVMEIIDLKYGKGVAVSAEGNAQMRLYALGAISEYGFLYDIQTVRMTIIQPRLDSVSTDEMSVEDLLKWADEVVRPKAKLAEAGEGEFVPGDHCRWCKVNATCRARAEVNLEMAKYEFQEPPLLSVEEIGEILYRAEALQKWASDIQSYAFEQAEKHGVKIPGWKLVEGRSNRTYTDKQAVAETLIIEGYEEDKIYKPRDILGITDMEKTIGKKLFADLLDGLVIKPAGKPVLVSENDSRPELNSAASAAADFAEE